MSRHFVPPHPKPPAHIARYVDLLGEDLTVTFLLEFGGADLYLAPNPKGRSVLVEVVGLNNATLLAKHSERLPRRVPTGKHWIAAVLKSRGLSVADIARKLHSTDVSVRNWLKSWATPSSDDDQLPLI